MRRRADAALVLAAMLVCCGPGLDRPPDRDHIGSAACRRCHEQAYAAWAASLHALAARPAVPAHVQAPFDGRAVTGATAAVLVRMSGERVELQPAAGGAPLRPTIVLGRTAVEQYLVPLERGRLQAFPLAYDPGAGEWFDLFPDGPAADDWRHWTQPGATANGQCLECHVTGWEKGYDPAHDRYASRWTELGVGCEACHGPGARHVRAREAATATGDSYAETRSRPGSEACMPCHSLRVVIAAGWVPGAPLADHFDPELLDTGAWYTDGQLRAEAYEWTSFQMSRMAAAGVVCEDCHEPHGGRLRAEGNALCLRCHEGALGTEAHTHHPAPSSGSTCVGCHMPEHVFMGRDRRRDHAFTRPDPHRARTLGAPDACTACHHDHDRAWAAEQVAAWYGGGGGDGRRRAAHGLAVLLEAGSRGARTVAEPLCRLLASDLDPIRRASAARFLAGMTEVPDVVETLRQAAADREPLVRGAAVRALGEVAARADVRATLVAATRDARRLVRVEAAFALAGTSPEGLERGERIAVEEAFREWLVAQAPTADLPETHFNQGVFWTARGDIGKAEAAYRRAIALWPQDLTPRQNLAMLLVENDRAREAERELREILSREPDWPPATFGLALVRLREERFADAIEALEACLRRAPTHPRAAYRLGEAYLAAGDERAAAAAFERATKDPTSRREALRQLVRLAHRWNDRELVARWLPQALLADPATANDPAVREALGIRTEAPAGAPAP